MLAGLTPKKIRRKRGAAPGEAWKASRKRPRPVLQSTGPSSRSSVDSGGSSRASSARPRKRKWRHIELSRLEELPSEILQHIFELSGNLQLALASFGLSRQLSSEHLHWRLTQRILGRVLGYEEGRADDADLSAATRLLNARFLTWPFFRRWLRQHCDQHEAAMATDMVDYATLWADLRPSPGLLPPTKLLHGPWSSDRVAFLRAFAGNITDISSCSLYHADLAHEGLVQAISEQAVDAVHLLLDLGLTSSQDLLRQAVMDDGCNREIVEMLFQRATFDEQYDAVNERWVRQSSLDTLDPALWAWIDQAEQKGNAQGLWLKDMLRSGNAPASSG